MKTALIVYGTRYGAAASTSQEIAATLQQEGFAVKVVNAKEEKIHDIAPFELVIVGSGVQINRWTSEPEDFLKKHQKEFAAKKLALFVCCGSASSPSIADEKSPPPEELKAKYLDAKASQYGLQPIALGFFGGVYNFNKTPWWAKRALDAQRPKIAAAYKEAQPNVYDTRDLGAIRNWAKDLVRTVNTV